jgi:hypothetical protein
VDRTRSRYPEVMLPAASRPSNADVLIQHQRITLGSRSWGHVCGDGHRLPDRGCGTSPRAHVATPGSVCLTAPRRGPSPAGSRPGVVAVGHTCRIAARRRHHDGYHHHRRPVPASRRRDRWHQATTSVKATRANGGTRGRRWPSPAGSRPGGYVPTWRRRGQLAPTTRTSPVAATRSKLGDVGGNVGLARGQRRPARVGSRPVPAGSRPSRDDTAGGDGGGPALPRARVATPGRSAA